MLLRRVIEHVKAQNWTAVGLDFVIVVVGVFIALAVQERAQERRQQEAIADMIAAMDRSVEDGLGTIAMRMSRQPCDVARLEELRQMLVNSGPDWPGAAIDKVQSNRPTTFNPVYSPFMVTSYPTDAYQRARLGGALESLSTVDQEFYLYFFISMRTLTRAAQIESDLIGEISVLSQSVRVDDARRFEMLRLISRLDAINGLFWSQAYQTFDQARERGIKLSPPMQAEYEQALKHFQRDFGDCVTHIDIPLTDFNRPPATLDGREEGAN